jgi:hypothetical protein
MPLLVLLIGFYVIELAREPTTANFSVLGPLLLLTLGFVYLFWTAPSRAARKQFRGQPAAQGFRTVIIDEDGVHSRWDTGSADVAYT